VPFCLKCVAGEGVISVIMEHLEDVVIQYEASWLFIQIKTRNATRGPWRFSDAIDGLKSLHRIFGETRHLNAEYHLYLEGSVQSRDDLQELVGDGSAISETVRERIAEELEIDEAERAQFLAAVTVRPEQPPRDYVEHRNIEILGERAPELSRIEIKAMHRRVLDELQAAMARERVITLMPRYIGDPNALQEDEKRKVEAKRLTQDSLLRLMEPVVTGGHLLRTEEFLETETTKLEQKLVAGGADARIISDAKMLRANATIRESEFLAATLYDSGKINNVRLRLRVFANGAVSRYRDETAPASQAWSDLLDNLHEQATTLDQHRVYHRDPMLLLGAICDMSDECIVDWGGHVA